MNKYDIAELFKTTYERTVKDNQEDFMITFKMLSKLCTYLGIKEILSESDIKDILNINVGENNE